MYVRFNRKLISKMKNKKIRISLFLFACFGLCVSSCKKKSEDNPTPDGTTSTVQPTASLFKIINVYVSGDSINFEKQYSYEYDSEDRVSVFHKYSISADAPYYKEEISQTKSVYSYFPNLTLITTQFQSARDNRYYFASYDSVQLDPLERPQYSKSFCVYMALSEAGDDSMGVKIHTNYTYSKDLRGNVIVSKGTSLNDPINESTSIGIYDDDMDVIAVDSVLHHFVYDTVHFGRLPVGDFSIPGNNHKKLLVSYDASTSIHYKINWTFDVQGRPITQTVIQSDSLGTSKFYRKFTY
jgi:hypothetical protein